MNATDPASPQLPGSDGCWEARRAIAVFGYAMIRSLSRPARKDCFGETPKPARETCALPVTISNALSLFRV